MLLTCIVCIHAFSSGRHRDDGSTDTVILTESPLVHLIVFLSRWSVLRCDHVASVRNLSEVIEGIDFDEQVKPHKCSSLGKAALPRGPDHQPAAQ